MGGGAEISASWDRGQDTARGDANQTSFLDIEDMLFEVMSVFCRTKAKTLLDNT